MIIKIFNRLLNRIKLYAFKQQWRKNNPHNSTYCGNCFPIEKVSVGNNSYGTLYVTALSKDACKLSIGNFCSIGGEVSFILGAEHRTDTISTFPFKTRILQEPDEAFSKGNIVVDDDVWIGNRATIMSGVHIGQGAVVAAGAVVTKDVPPYAVVGGVPAKVIKYRFKPELREELLKIDYSELTEDSIKEHIEDLYVDLENKEQLKWLHLK